MKKHTEEVVVAPTTAIEESVVVEEVEKTAEMPAEGGIEVVEMATDEAQAEMGTAPEIEATSVAEVAKATDPQDDVRDVIAAVTKAVTELAASVFELRERVEASAGASTIAEVAKSEEQVSTDALEAVIEDGGEPVEKTALEANIVNDLVKAMESAVAQAVAPLQQRIAELEVQPVDKSIAVSKLNTQEEAPDPLEMYRRVADQNNLTGSDLLRGAIEIAFRGGK